MNAAKTKQGKAQGDGRDGFAYQTEAKKSEETNKLKKGRNSIISNSQKGFGQDDR